MPRAISITVNGTKHSSEVEPSLLLVEYLREKLLLTGTHVGCDTSQCGACTVLVDGQPVKSCQARASVLQGKTIATIESLEQNGRLHPVQQAFLKHEAMQCAYCTPGMIMAAVGLLASTPHPTDEAIVKAMDKNVCRCGVYPRIIAAIRDAAAAS
jgi:carbon-monoxide dehydrogenase small subunit